MEVQGVVVKLWKFFSQPWIPSKSLHLCLSVKAWISCCEENVFFAGETQGTRGNPQVDPPPKMGHIPGNLQKEQPAVVQSNIPELKIGSFGFWLLVEPTHWIYLVVAPFNKICWSNWIMKPQVDIGAKLKNIWNHHLDYHGSRKGDDLTKRYLSKNSCSASWFSCRSVISIYVSSSRSVFYTQFTPGLRTLCTITVRIWIHIHTKSTSGATVILLTAGWTKRHLGKDTFAHICPITYNFE